MADGRFAILDPAAGISGDMVLGALVAAGAPADWLRALPDRLGAPGVTITIEEVDRCGVRCTKVNVVLPGGEQELPAEAVARDQHHAHAQGLHLHDPAHRHISDLIASVESAPLSPWVRERAVGAFRLLGEAEGQVHGMPAEQVALHELGAVDALIDIVGSIEGFERLGISRIYNRPVGLGDGWVRAAHGVIPVPAPATGILLEGIEIGPAGPLSGEAVTPTGAALLRVLSEGPPPSRWRAVHGGAWGAGGRNPTGYPNALRLILAEPGREAADVVLLSTDLDDLSPEYLEPLREALVASGALDVQVWPTQMKKGRVGFRIEALSVPGDADRVVDAFFRHSTTAGVRRHSAERVTLSRREVQVAAADGTSVRVKVLDAPDGLRLKPEYDDVVALARRTGQPAHEVARDLRERAIRLVSAAVDARPQPHNKES
ncbi:MAG: nickel pincer cofactor biosynthesis protein LarC [Gemmatimonadota bacterium]|nr:nickel pincer cofactor biosynthesis protein LarC [Gemmatimonadota bacterium]